MPNCDRTVYDTYAIGAYELAEGQVLTGDHGRRHLYGAGHAVLLVDGDPDTVTAVTTGGIFDYPPGHTVYIAR